MKSFSQEDKIKICEMRLRDCSIYEIAETIQFSRQAIILFLRSFPVDYPEAKTGRLIIDKDNKEGVSSTLPYEEQLEICKQYIDGRSIDEIKYDLNCTEEDIKTVFFTIRRRKVKQFNSVYNELSDWLVSNGYTIPEFSQKLGISTARMRHILKGVTPMPDDVMKNITKLTGIEKLSATTKEPIEKIDEKVG